ncbi:MAG: GTPase HflX [Pseudomonadota bacterium]
MHPLVVSQKANDKIDRAPEARLEEACGLAAAIELDIVGAQIVSLTRLRPATLFGVGKVKEISDQLDAISPRPDLVIVDSALSPVQHRNLEKEWACKVLDRTALILEIFGARANTAEGRIQVELAHLTYQRSRLVRSWTHLERQRGGAGFLGGPGERQIEADRRALATKIDRLRIRLEQVRRTRTLQRAKRKRAPHAVVALVGYTNAGKSTLFNRLTNADVKAQDLLFATLDPTMRAVTLASGEKIVLSDTVGFISDLPTQLIAAFRATLEEVQEADVIVHVRDAAHPDSDAQRDDVLSVLAALGVGGDKIETASVAGTAENEGPAVIEALNKIDLMDAEGRRVAEATARVSEERALLTIEEPLKVCLSAVTGEGVDTFVDCLNTLITRSRGYFEVSLGPADGAARAWLHQNGDIVEISSGDSDPHTDENAEMQASDRETILVRLSEKSAGQLKKRFPDIVTAPSTSNATPSGAKPSGAKPSSAKPSSERQIA